MAVFATLEQLKRHLNKTSSADDDELQDVLDAATEVVESLTGMAFGAEPVTERVTIARGVAVLSRRPVIGPVSVDGSPVGEDSIDRPAGLVYDLHTYYRRSAEATYTAGNGVVPASVMLACLIIAGHLWDTQRGTTLSPLSQQDLDTGQGFVGAGFAIPNRAKELLEPYLASPAVG